MNTTTIAQLAQSTLDGVISFPEILGRLMQSGAQSYEVFLKGNVRCTWTTTAIRTSNGFQAWCLLALDLSPINAVSLTAT